MSDVEESWRPDRLVWELVQVHSGISVFREKEGEGQMTELGNFWTGLRTAFNSSIE